MMDKTTMISKTYDDDPRHRRFARRAAQRPESIEGPYNAPPTPEWFLGDRAIGFACAVVAAWIAVEVLAALFRWVKL